MLLAVLPLFDGGRTAFGFGLYLAALGLGGIGLAPWRSSLTLMHLSLAALAAVSWIWLPWSSCPNETVWVALLGTALLVAAVGLPVVLSEQRARLPLCLGLGAGAVVSLLWVYRQAVSGAGMPDFWVDPEVAGRVLFRASGPMQNPNTFGAYLALSLPLLVALTLTCSRWRATGASVAAAAAVAGLTLSFSRAAWLGAAVGLLLVVLAAARYCPRRLWRLSPMLLALLGCLLLCPRAVISRGTTAPTLEQGTLRHRLFMWRAGCAMWRENRWFGRGPGAFAPLFAAYRPIDSVRTYALLSEPGSAHSDYVQMLSEQGLLGYALAGLCLAGLATLGGRALRRAASRPAPSLRVLSGLGTVAVALIGGVFQSNGRTPLCLLVVLLAMAFVAAPAAADVRPAIAARSLRWGWCSLCCFLVLGGVLWARSDELRDAALAQALAGRYTAALPLLLQARRLNPLNSGVPALQGDIASSQHLRGGTARELRSAERAYRQAIRLDPFGAVLYAKLADIVERQGQSEEALVLYNHAARLDYYRATYHLEAGRLAKLADRRGLAIAHLETSLALFPAWIELTRRRQGPDSLSAQTLPAAQRDAVRMLSALRKESDGVLRRRTTGPFRGK